tara:strand:+ start:1312 stop:1602 length:291 start_codon:yes stop_codon:yes gene_type:complete
MDTKAILNTKSKLNELAAQHNRLTTLCAFLLNEVSGLKKEISDLKSGNISVSGQSSNEIRSINTSSNNTQQSGSTNFSELKADEILRQLQINNTDN